MGGTELKQNITVSFLMNTLQNKVLNKAQIVKASSIIVVAIKGGAIKRYSFKQLLVTFKSDVP